MSKTVLLVFVPFHLLNKKIHFRQICAFSEIVTFCPRMASPTK